MRGFVVRLHKGCDAEKWWCSIDIESLQNRLLKVCYVPATSASLPRVRFFFSFLFLLLQPLTVLIKQTRWLKQSIFFRCLCDAPFLGRNHRYRKSKIDCLRFVMCPPATSASLLKLLFLFLRWPLTVLMKQTRQTVHAFKQSVLLRCVW